MLLRISWYRGSSARSESNVSLTYCWNLRTVNNSLPLCESFVVVDPIVDLCPSSGEVLLREIQEVISECNQRVAVGRTCHHHLARSGGEHEPPSKCASP